MSEAGTTQPTQPTQPRRNARAMIVTEDTMRQLRDLERGFNAMSGFIAKEFGVMERQRDRAVAAANAASTAVAERDRTIQALRVELAAALAKVPPAPPPEPVPEPEPLPEEPPAA